MRAVWILSLLIPLGWVVPAAELVPATVEEAGVVPCDPCDTVPPKVTRASTVAIQAPPLLSFTDFFMDAPAGDDFVLDPRLDVPLSFRDAVQQALFRHPDVLVARHTPEIARAEVQSARAVYDPEVFAEWVRSEDRDHRMSYTAYYNRKAFTNTERAGLRQRLPTGGEVTAYREWVDGSESGGGYPKSRVDGAANVVEVTQPLLRGFGDRENRTRIRIARIQVDVSDEEFNQAVADALAQTAQSYWQFVGAREEILIAREVLAKAEEVLAREKTRHGEGLLMELDVERATEAVAGRTADLLRAEEQFAVAREQLELFLGIEGEATECIVPVEPLDTPPFTVDLEAAVERALAMRPEVRAAGRRIEESEARRAYARHLRLPQLNVVGGVRDNRPRRWDDVGGDSRDMHGTDWRVGVEISSPLGFMEARAAMRQADAELAQKHEEHRRAQRQAVTEARTAAKQIDITRREIPTAARAVASAGKVIEGEMARWELNQVGNQDLLRAHDLLAAARRNHLQARLRYNIALVNFHHAQGMLLERLGVVVEPPAAKHNPWHLRK